MAINHIKPSMGTSVKKMLQKIADIECIPPRNGKEYTAEWRAYHVGDGEIVRLNERQSNLAVIMATEPKMTAVHMAVKAGYDVRKDIAWDKDTPQKQISAKFQSIYTNATNQKVMALKNHIQKGACKAVSVDAEWLLGQQVSLYEEARSNKKYGIAARILYDISGHIHIDSRATNKVEIESDVNYSALLNAADKRVQMEQGITIDVTPPDAASVKNKTTPPPPEVTKGWQAHES